MPSGNISDWMNWLMPYVGWRLARALGVDDTGKLPRLLCEHRATIRVSNTHFDVTFALAELPIAVRLSGLDRNPGWVPAAGRFVAFHYD